MLSIRRIDRSTMPPTEHKPITAWQVKAHAGYTLIYNNPSDIPTFFGEDWQLIVTTQEA
jgi:hypothetical protein